MPRIYRLYTRSWSIRNTGHTSSSFAPQQDYLYHDTPSDPRYRIIVVADLVVNHETDENPAAEHHHDHDNRVLRPVKQCSFTYPHQPHDSNAVLISADD